MSSTRHLVRPQSPSPHRRTSLAQPVGRSLHVAGRAGRRNISVFAAAVQGRQTVLHSPTAVRLTGPLCRCYRPPAGCSVTSTRCPTAFDTRFSRGSTCRRRHLKPYRLRRPRFVRRRLRTTERILTFLQYFAPEDGARTASATNASLSGSGAKPQQGVCVQHGAETGILW